MPIQSIQLNSSQMYTRSEWSHWKDEDYVDDDDDVPLNNSSPLVLISLSSVHSVSVSVGRYTDNLMFIVDRDSNYSAAKRGSWRTYVTVAQMDLMNVKLDQSLPNAANIIYSIFSSNQF